MLLISALCYCSYMVYDFHTHTCLSDGDLTPIELIRRAVAQGYRAVAVTDHVGAGALERVIMELKRDCALAQSHWNIVAIPGVELTHVPPGAIDEIAARARKLGAKLVVVHGETIVEPVEKGTNMAAVCSLHVNILAHPGFLTREETDIAIKNGIFIEITARKGHALTNGHVALMTKACRTNVLVNSDTHTSENLLTSEFAAAVAQGSGIAQDELIQILELNPQNLLRKLS